MVDEQQRRRANGGYVFGEAFCLMEYASKDGREIEYIWNSRDGVTPFIVMSRRGTELSHAHWSRDRRIVDFVPQPGSRLFVDVTEERAREVMTQRVERGWDDRAYPMKDQFESKDDAIDQLTADMWRPGEPDIKVVE